MAENADWSGLSSQLLTKIFELQHNALDNCAAACTCASWRCAVNRSHIPFLHLHAERSFSYKHWSNFFLSKLSVGILRLTASFDLTGDIHDMSGMYDDVDDVTNDDMNDVIYDDMDDEMDDDNIWARTFMQQVALTCDYLDTDEAFATELHYLALQPVQLKKLTAWLPFQRYTASCCMFPDIRHLTQLTTLHIQLNDKLSTPLIGSQTLSRIPESLNDLTIQGYNLEWDQVYKPNFIQPLIQPCLAFIQSLRLQECRVAFVGDGITCLCRLRSFSTTSSEVWADINNLDKLTKLTCLDLANSLWHELGAHTDMFSLVPSGPLASFTAWPELKVLKTVGCNLFHPSTQLDLPGVQEIQVRQVVPQLVNVRLHLHQDYFDQAVSGPQALLHPSCATCLVDLRLNLDYSVLGSASGLAAILQQVLFICKSLQVLHLSNFAFGNVNLDDAVNIRLHEQCGEQLTQLHLEHLSCNILDLASSAFLTSVKLHCQIQAWCSLSAIFAL